VVPNIKLNTKTLPNKKCYHISSIVCPSRRGGRFRKICWIELRFVHHQENTRTHVQLLCCAVSFLFLHPSHAGPNTTTHIHEPLKLEHIQLPHVLFHHQDGKPLSDKNIHKQSLKHPQTILLQRLGGTGKRPQPRGCIRSGRGEARMQQGVLLYTDPGGPDNLDIHVRFIWALGARIIWTPMSVLSGPWGPT